MSDSENTVSKQYLTFRLEKETFALNVTKVREILDVIPITKVPQSPEFMKGVINVRGSVVPVADLKLKFSMEPIETTLDTRIIVLEILMEEELLTVGVLADAVLDVMDIEKEAIEPPPKIGAKWKTDFIRGIGKHEEDFIIILDIDRVFSMEEMALIKGPDENEAEGAERNALMNHS